MTVRVAMIGLGFGAEFIPIYQRHPHADMYAICQRDREKLDEIGDAVRHREALHGLPTSCSRTRTSTRSTSTRRSPITRWMTHRGARRPASTSPAPCRWRRASRTASRSSSSSKKTGLKYMMMETVVYAREYLFIKELYDKGELGKIQFLQASHQQDMDGWPNYWPGLPPMWYATHCVGPCSRSTDADGRSTSRCFGSGTIREELIKHYGSPFAVETAHIKFKDSDVTARIYPLAVRHRRASTARASTSTARKKSFEWPLIEHEPLVLHTAKRPEPKIPKPIKVPDFAEAAARRRSSASPPRASTTRREDAPELHAGRRPRRLASAPRARVRHARSSKTATRSRTPRSPPTGPASACAPTSPRSRAARSCACPSSPSRDRRLVRRRP